MKRLLVILTTLLLLPFGLKAMVLRPVPTTVWGVVGIKPTTVSLQQAVLCLGLSNSTLAMNTVTKNFPDTIWIRRGDFFPAMTFGAGKVTYNLSVGFDSTKALRWSVPNGTEIVMVLGCNNVAWRWTEIKPSVTATAVAPALLDSSTVPLALTQKASGVTIPWRNWLAALSILALFGLVLAVLYWIFRQIGNPVNGGPGIAPTKPEPEAGPEAVQFETELDERDEDIDVLNRLLAHAETQREGLIKNRQLELQKTAEVTEAELRRLREL